MLDELLVPMMVASGTASIAFYWRESRALGRRQRALGIVLQATMLDAARRRHGTITPDHLLRTLLDVPEIAAEWIAQGWPLAALQRALDARLEALPARPGDAESPAEVSPELLDLVTKARVAAARMRSPPARAGQAMLSALHRELVDREPTVAELFTEHGVSPSPLTLSSREGGQTTGETAQAGSPYRSASVEPVVHVVFWNDRRTTMKAVVEVLTNIFGLSETRATYLMLTVHHEGRAVVWSSGRAQAEALASRATLAAREKGMPLRVTTEV